MTHTLGRWTSALLAALLSFVSAPARAQEAGDEAAENAALGFERTPPRLSFADGDVSYWRPGATDWTDAKVNTPLAVGDELATGTAANLELQVGSRAYVRAGEATQLGLTTLEPDYLQLRVASGTTALDLRELSAGQTLEIDTPNAAFTIERKGYYRIEVGDGTTKFITRRGGRASVTTEGGLPAEIGANEQLVVTGTTAPVLATYGAPELDAWDRWNYGRSDEQIAGVSSRYVPEGVYGADDLDESGSWRTEPEYGAVWVPRVATGWVPYSAGTWVADPYYGWTWVDDAPWGWAPFHYGRWVYVSNAWAWSPGPRVVRPYYAPALVAFYGGPSVSVSVSFPIGSFGWVALGWGEPVVPWWGPSGCRGQARWAGWGGPRVVNNITIKNKNYYNVNNIHGYQNAHHRGAMVTSDRERFGRGHASQGRTHDVDTRNMRPLNRGDLGVRSDRANRSAGERRASRPSRDLLDRRVVTSREPGRTRAGSSGISGNSPDPSRTSRFAGHSDASRTVGSTRDNARGGSRIDARPARLQAPPVRTARAETSDRTDRSPRTSRANPSETRDRRNSVSDRPNPTRARSSQSMAPAPPRRASSERRSSATERAPQQRERASQTRASRSSAAPERASSRTPDQASPRAPSRTESRRSSSMQAPERTRSAERAPRASAASQQRQERATTAPRQRQERAAPSPASQSSARQSSARQSPARQSIERRERPAAREPSVRQAPRERAVQQQPQRQQSQPRQSPAGNQSSPRTRDGGGGGGGNNGGGERRNDDGGSGGGGGRSRRG